MTRDESFNGKVHCTHVFGVWWARVAAPVKRKRLNAWTVRSLLCFLYVAINDGYGLKNT
jgi:hypothetical protein